ncbi:MAG: septum formation inhibitor Maf [Betaproteobacteria bacterium]|nr:septum formation inhibitor Maf [Betaproteobacteria bacterium]
MSKPVFLASQSPRRLELLRQLGALPSVLHLRGAANRQEVDETPLASELAVEYVMRVALMKAAAGVRAQRERGLPDLPIIAADTTVTIDGQILGKPADAEEAAAMLRTYAGREHTVLTAVAVAYKESVRSALNESTVRFKALSEAEIAAYIACGEPFDKAGGYGVQGRAAMFIERLCGSYTGVMGLPLFETSELLREAGYPLL